MKRFAKTGQLLRRRRQPSATDIVLTGLSGTVIVLGTSFGLFFGTAIVGLGCVEAYLFFDRQMQRIREPPPHKEK